MSETINFRTEFELIEDGIMNACNERVLKQASIVRFEIIWLRWHYLEVDEDVTLKFDLPTNLIHNRKEFTLPEFLEDYVTRYGTTSTDVNKAPLGLVALMILMFKYPNISDDFVKQYLFEYSL